MKYHLFDCKTYLKPLQLLLYRLYVNRKMLSDMALDLCQFADSVLYDDGDRPEVLWSTVCTQLELGEFKLKMVTH